MDAVNDPGKYLGLPSIWGRATMHALSYIKDKISIKKKLWGRKKIHYLTEVVKEVLIKAVAQAILMHPMNVFKFLAATCKEIDSLLARFWWGQKEDKAKIHWVNWKSLGMPKIEGGMGFRNLHDFNIALLVKQSWRILHEPYALWVRVLKGRYFLDGK
ncbi:unnamed protein product [Prunus armeniaca]